MATSIASTSTIAPAALSAAPATAPVDEKRVTRSALPPSRSHGGAAPPAEEWLPLNTPLLLTTHLPPNIVHRPPPEETAPLASIVGSAPGSEPGQQLEPRWRALAPTEQVHSRSRLPPQGPESDLSDAHYMRLHRYPDILEKRSARLERERLIHERRKLIEELEELKGKGWVYDLHKGKTGAKGKEDRRRKIEIVEEKLARYDALLPNQPRKSNSLAASTSASLLPLPSPALAAPTPSSRPSPPPAIAAQQQQQKQQQKIRIVFKDASGVPIFSTESRGMVPYVPKAVDQSLDPSRQKAEMAYEYALQHLTTQPAKLSKSHGHGHGKRKRGEDEDEEDLDMSPAAVWGRYAKNNKSLLRIDSYFRSEALRKAVEEAAKPGRRSSARVAYAWGNRIPENLLQDGREFMIHGFGRAAVVDVAEDEDELLGEGEQEPQQEGRSLEELARERLGISPAAVAPVVMGGITVPGSAMEVMRTGGIKEPPSVVVPKTEVGDKMDVDKTAVA